MFTPTRYFVLSEMAYTTSAKAKSPVHQQKFKSIKHEQVLVDNAVEDFVDRAWFGRASSNVFPQRDEMRRKLLTGRSKTVAGRGGLEVSESDLVALWPLFLNVDTQAARPSLSLLDVELMIEQRETWKYNDTDPRILKDAEVAAIETWYESARARDPPARRLSENGRHAMKAKIGDVAPRFGRYSTKTGSIEARNTRRTDRRGRAACHAIHAGLGLQYPDPDEDLAAFTQASDSEEEGHVESPVKRRRCEPVGHAEVSRAASCGGGGELANARIPDGSSADGKQAPPSHSSCTTARARDPPARIFSKIGRHAEVGEEQRKELGEETVKRTKKRTAFGLETRASMNDEKKAGRLACGMCSGLSCGPYEHQTAYHVCGICESASCDGLSCNLYYAFSTVEHV